MHPTIAATLDKLRRLATVGHAVAAVVLLAVAYNLWGQVFQPGGTGSNVVLGLILAIAAVYAGTTFLGPNIDELMLKPVARNAYRARREAADVAADVAAMLEAQKKKKTKPKLTDDAQAAIAQSLAGLRGALAPVDQAGPRAATEAQVAALTSSLQALDKVLQQHLPRQSASSQARGLATAFALAVVLRLFLVAPFQIPSGSMIPTLLIGDHLFVFRASYGLQSPVGKEPSYWVRWASPKVGDIVVFEAPPWVGRNAGEDWIKRTIATAGQTVKIRDNVVIVDDKPYAKIGANDGAGELVSYMDHEEAVVGPGTWHEAHAMSFEEDAAGWRHAIFYEPSPGSPSVEWPLPGIPDRARARGLRCTDAECTVEDGFIFVMGDNRDHSQDGRFFGAVPIDNVKGKALFIWVSVDGSDSSISLGKFSLPRFRWERIFDACR